MHKLYTFIALLTLLQSTSIHAQKLTVTNFQETINQMTVDMQQRDFNNEICAIVMVENANGLKPTKVIALPVQTATPYSYQQTEL
jgi:uncharacterized protein involved in tellurium resistance